jgi:3,4-dihydroxy 2-butanone 4-phosphate synthase/GTP cyclohydrolase II
MVKRGRGLVCLAMTPEALGSLEIPLEVSNNSSRGETAMCVSIDAKAGTTTGISSSDRRGRFARRSIRRRSREIWRGLATCFRCAPRKGGVMVRAGHTEAAVIWRGSRACRRPA